jgi:hypothetical protein
MSDMVALDENNNTLVPENHFEFHSLVCLTFDPKINRDHLHSMMKKKDNTFEPGNRCVHIWTTYRQPDSSFLGYNQKQKNITLTLPYVFFLNNL